MKPRQTSSALQSLIQHAQMLQQSGAVAAAAEQYRKLLQQYPNSPQLLTGLGTIALQQNDLEQAEILLGKSLKILPKQEQALLSRGIALALLKRPQEAIACYTQTLKLTPDNAEIYNLRGFACQEAKQFQKALADYDKALLLKPDAATIYNNRGNVQQELKCFAEAIVSFDQAIALNADYAEAYFNRGNAQKELLKLDDALASYDSAIAVKADFAQAHNNRGLLLFSLTRFEEALSSFEQALSLSPDYPEALNNRGLALDRLKRYIEALKCFEQAVNLKPDYAEACFNHGDTLVHLKCKPEALASYEKAFTLKPDYAEAYVGHGSVLDELKQYQSALASYDKALALEPDFVYLRGKRLCAKLQICDWQDMADAVQEMTAKIERGEQAYNAFTVMSLTDNLALQRKAAEIWTANKSPAADHLGKISKYPTHDKIRVGYFSMDFRAHAVSLLTAELFEKHDRSRFEIFAFSYGPNTQDQMRLRLEVAFDRFIDVQDLSDLEIAKLARELEIDIAVDLAGHTGDCRTGILALRAAPVQVSYIGYLGTMAAEYMDYMLADTVLIPPANRRHYQEKIVYLPSYQVNDRQRRIAETVFSRAELGLPETGFVFCCFNNNFKITEATFASWMRILNSVTDSVLFIYAENEFAQKNLQQAAVASGVAADRLVFGKALPMPEYIARYRAADLFLDTQPYNAGTTASDALWAGLPVLACTGQSFASRMAASLLTAIDLPELITSTPAEYELLAIELASNPEKMAAIKAKLQQNRLTTLLFDSQRFTRHIEAAYLQIYQRNQASLPVEDIEISLPCNN